MNTNTHSGNSANKSVIITEILEESMPMSRDSYINNSAAMSTTTEDIQIEGISLAAINAENVDDKTFKRLMIGFMRELMPFKTRLENKIDDMDSKLSEIGQETHSNSAEVKSLRVDLDKWAQENQILTEKFENFENSLIYQNEQQMKELQEREKRSSNLILFKIAEAPNESVDTDTVGKLLHDLNNTLDEQIRANIPNIKAIRLGKKNQALLDPYWSNWTQGRMS